jgi:hypothetical protein
MPVIYTGRQGWEEGVMVEELGQSQLGKTGFLAYSWELGKDQPNLPFSSFYSSFLDV